MMQFCVALVYMLMTYTVEEQQSTSKSDPKKKKKSLYWLTWPMWNFANQNCYLANVDWFKKEIQAASLSSLAKNLAYNKLWLLSECANFSRVYYVSVSLVLSCIENSLNFTKRKNKLVSVSIVEQTKYLASSETLSYVKTPLPNFRQYSLSPMYILYLCGNAVILTQLRLFHPSRFW